MKNLQFQVDAKLWAELRKTAETLNEKYRKFYVQCITDGLEYHQKRIEQCEAHDLLTEMAHNIVMKSDQNIDEPQLIEVDFPYKGDLVVVEGVLRYYMETIEGGDTAPLTRIVSVYFGFSDGYPVFYDAENAINANQEDLADEIRRLVQ